MHHFVFFFFNDTATTEIYTLSLHDALPIWTRAFTCSLTALRISFSPAWSSILVEQPPRAATRGTVRSRRPGRTDRKSTRLNSSHANISYAVFCLKKKTIHMSNVRFSLITRL